jgi:hypothetical protein
LRVDLFYFFLPSSRLAEKNRDKGQKQRRKRPEAKQSKATGTQEQQRGAEEAIAHARGREAARRPLFPPLPCLLLVLSFKCERAATLWLDVQQQDGFSIASVLTSLLFLPMLSPFSERKERRAQRAGQQSLHSVLCSAADSYV